MALSPRLPITLRTLLMGGDMVAFGMALYATERFIIRMGELWGMMPLLENRTPYYVMLTALVMLICALRGHYKRRVPWWTQLQLITKVMAAMAALDVLIHLTLKLETMYLQMATFWVVATIMLIAARLSALYLASHSRAWRLPVVIIGNASVIITDTLHALLADGMTGYQVEVALWQGAKNEQLTLDFLPKNHPPVTILNAHDVDIFEYITHHPESFYVICLDGFREHRRDKLLEVLEDAQRHYAIIPQSKRLHLYGMEPHYFFGNDVMLLHKRDNFVHGFAVFLKRLIDVLASGAVLPILGLITIIVWLGKRISGSTTPLFYGGERIGLNGTHFPCWKFCTMRADADQVLAAVLASDPDKQQEWAHYQKLKDDPRVDSTISGWLRTTSLDELPQCWNVFRGQMSLVGPRPIIPDQMDEYGKDYSLYTSVKPGLTGLWQVSGRNETSFKQRIMWDYWYVRNWSLWHDIVILTKTIRVFLTRSGAY